jgi:hypothetical protein
MNMLMLWRLEGSISHSRLVMGWGKHDALVHVAWHSGLQQARIFTLTQSLAFAGCTG